MILFWLPFLSIFYFTFSESKFFFLDIVIIKYFCDEMINFSGAKIIFESNLGGSWSAQNPMDVYWQMSSILNFFLNLFPYIKIIYFNYMAFYSAEDCFKNNWHGSSF